ncbi:MAG: FAD-dependent monooxygenase [Bdellovibrionales bacterium]|nr:FAD-dependent monooxygenase [Bdellovibrionales bacterium]
MVLGHSEGTQVAVDFANQYPSDVTNLILVGFSGENLATTSEFKKLSTAKIWNDMFERPAIYHEAAPIRVDLSTIPSPYNFILILSQSETVTSLFVVGSDGSHSIVRQQVGIPFHGAMYAGDFILGDVTIDWPWPYDSIQTFVSKRGVIASFPMKGDRKYRLILIPKENNSPAEKSEITLAEFNSILQTLGRGQIRATDATWLTRFRVHHRMVEHFQKGRIFLAGDAAHIHSPAGGQGMNTGIQDALNLAHKLKRFLDGKIPIECLAAYERERSPVARKVVRGTDFVFKMALLPESPAVGLIRSLLLPKIVRSSFIQRRVALAISEVNVARREIQRYGE